MDYIKDFIYVQKKAINNTLKSFRYVFIVFIIIFTGALAINITNNVLNLLFGFGIISMLKGIIIYILEIFIISFIMAVSYSSITKNSSLGRLSNHDKTQHMYKIIQIGFIFYIARLILGMIGLSTNFYYLSYFIILIFNALPETIYLENYDGLNSILQSIEFLKNNLLNWILPNLIVFVLFKFLSIPYILNFYQLLSKDPKELIISGVIVLIYSVYIIYRGNMYEILKGSSKRKREYMRNFD